VEARGGSAKKRHAQPLSLALHYIYRLRCRFYASGGRETPQMEALAKTKLGTATGKTQPSPSLAALELLHGDVASEHAAEGRLRLDEGGSKEAMLAR